MVVKLISIIAVALCVTYTSAAPSTLKDIGKEKPFPKDYFEDEIRNILQMSVKELLEYTFETFSKLTAISVNTIAEMAKLQSQAAPDVAEDLGKIKDYLECQTSGNVSNIISDLSKVLPSLSDRSKHEVVSVNGDIIQFSAGDIIWALLQLTLKAFIQLIANTLEASDKILVGIMIEFERLATEARPEVGNALIKISDDFLVPARMVVLPVLHDLQKVLGSKRKSKEAFKQPGNPQQSIRSV